MLGAEDTARAKQSPLPRNLCPGGSDEKQVQWRVFCEEGWEGGTEPRRKGRPGEGEGPRGHDLSGCQDTQEGCLWPRRWDPAGVVRLPASSALVPSQPCPPAYEAAERWHLFFSRPGGESGSSLGPMAASALEQEPGSPPCSSRPTASALASALLPGGQAIVLAGNAGRVWPCGDCDRALPLRWVGGSAHSCHLFCVQKWARPWHF